MIKIESKESDKEVSYWKGFGPDVEYSSLDGDIYVGGLLHLRYSPEGARELAKDLLRAAVYAESAPKLKSRSRKVGLYGRLQYAKVAATYLQLASEDSKEVFTKAIEHVYEALLSDCPLATTT